MTRAKPRRLACLAGLTLLAALAACERPDTTPTGPRPAGTRPSFSTSGVGTWQTTAPMPTVPYLGVIIVPIGSRIYAVGGDWSSGALITSLEYYDPAADAWAKLAPAPVPVGAFGAAGVAGKLYVVGGCAFNSDCRVNLTGMLQIYDPATNTWSSGSPMPTPRGSMAGGAIGGKLYVAGGGGPCPPCISLATLEIYDPSTGAWTTGAPMPTSVHLVGAAVTSGKLYVLGGLHWPPPGWPTINYDVRATVQVYDPATNTWTTAAPMPQPRAQMGATVLNGILYPAGGVDSTAYGSNPDGVGNLFESYDPSSNSWTELPPLPRFVSNASAASLNGTLFLAGADVGGPGIPSLLTYAPAPSDQTPPVVSANISGTLGQNGWYTSNVTVSWNAADPESGVASESGCSTVTLTHDTPGVTYTCTAVNGVGLSTTQSVTVKRDATPPAIGYSGNAGSYTVDQAVNIICSASDATSGLASTTCANITGAAYSFGVGTSSFSAVATDNAGNSAAASTSFSVIVTAASLGNLTNQWVTKAGVASSLNAKLVAAQQAAQRGDLNAKAGQINAYINQLNAQSGKAVTAAHAAILISLARAL